MTALTWERHGAPAYRYVGYFFAAAYYAIYLTHVLHRVWP